MIVARGIGLSAVLAALLLQGCDKSKSDRAALPSTPLESREGERDAGDLPALIQHIAPSVLLLSVMDRSGQEIAVGSGFVVSEDGRVVTNRHVIEKADKVLAKAENGAIYEVAGVLAEDAVNDLAVLKLKATNLPALRLGFGYNAKAGERIVVVGSPLGLKNTATEGIISARRQTEGEGEWLQITAPISPGSSGSPVVNQRGEVIGVATMLMRGGQSLNFARPAKQLATLLASIVKAAKPAAFATNEAADQRDPIFDDPDFRASWEHITKGEEAQALKLVQQALKRHPESATGCDRLGSLMSSLGFQADALNASQRAVKLDPTNWLAWSNLGCRYRDAGKRDEAIKALRQSVKLTPKIRFKVQTLHSIADVMMMQFNESEEPLKKAHLLDAIGTLKEIVSIQPDDTDAWKGITTFSTFFTADFALAEEGIKNLQRLDPKEAATMRKNLDHQRSK